MGSEEQQKSSPENRPFISARALIFLGAHLLAGFIFLAPAYVRPDSAGVYAYLRSAVFDGDLLLFNEWAEFGLIRDGITIFKEVSRAGALANHWGIGTSILAAPAYVTARLLSALISPDNGFLGFSGTILAWSTVMIAALASLLADLALRRIAPELTAGMRTVAIAAVWIGTPMFWYEYRLPLGSHAAGAFAIAAVCALLSDPDRLADHRWSFLLGLSFGLAVTTRIQHVVIAPAILYFFIVTRQNARSHAAAAAGATLPMILQAMAWLIVYGTPLGPLTQGANLEQSTWAAFDRVTLAPVLFSSYHGLFSWAPITLLSLLGLIAGIVKGPRVLSMTLMLFFAAEWFANGVFDRYFWAGLSFGPRRFVDLTVPFVIGLAMLIRWRRGPAIIAAILSMFWTVGIGVGVLAGQLSLSEDVSWSQLAGGFRGLGQLELSVLHSPLVESVLLRQSIGAVAILAVVLVIVAMVPRRPGVIVAWTVAYGFSILLVLGVLFRPTRERASSELARYGIDRARASRLGPLLDQQKLLQKERDYYRARGKERLARSTENQLQEIDRVIVGLGARR